MVNRLRLNEKTLRDAEPKPGFSYQIFDTEVIGVSVQIHASGARTFTIDYRHAGRQRRMNIGRWPEWSVTVARERAKELRRAIDERRDPLAVKEDFRGAPRVWDMIDRYIAEHLPKLARNNASDQVSMLKKMVEPAWGNKLVTEITKTDVARFLDFVAEGRPRPSKAKPNNRARKLQGHKPTPIRANRMGEVLRKMFTLAMEWEWRADNPAQGFHRRIEQAREQFLSPEELTRIAAVLDSAEDQRAASIIRMCMLTSARVATEIWGDHPNPPDGPKALDRFIERAARRDAQAAANALTAKRSRKAQEQPAPSPDELAAFYAAKVNSDAYLPPNMISAAMCGSMLTRGLVTPERLRMRGVR